MTDSALLALLLDSPRLQAHERRAFQDMLATLDRWSALTQGQRCWAQRVGARLRLPGVGKAPLDTRGSSWDPAAPKERKALLRGLQRDFGVRSDARRFGKL